MGRFKVEKFDLKGRGTGRAHEIPAQGLHREGFVHARHHLESPKATHTTIAIVETFAKIRELSRAVAELSDTKDRTRQKSLMRQGGDILADLLDDETRVSDSETTLELNFAVLKLKHTVKRKSKE